MTQTADNAGRRTLFVGIGVVLLLALAIGIAAARGAATPVAEKPTATVTEGTGTVDASGAPAPSAQTTGAPGAPGGTRPGAPGAPGGNRQPAGKTPGKTASAPKSPAASGSKLSTITAPPEKTIGMIVLPKGFKGARYDITFKPFGWGPSGQEGGRLIAQIVSAKAVDSGAKSLDKDFKGRNATLWCSPQVAKAIKLGGQYTGVMQVRPQADVGMLYLVEVDDAK